MFVLQSMHSLPSHSVPTTPHCGHQRWAMDSWSFRALSRLGEPPEGRSESIFGMGKDHLIHEADKVNQLVILDVLLGKLRLRDVLDKRFELSQPWPP